MCNQSEFRLQENQLISAIVSVVSQKTLRARLPCHCVIRLSYYVSYVVIAMSCHPCPCMVTIKNDHIIPDPYLRLEIKSSELLKESGFHKSLSDKSWAQFDDTLQHDNMKKCANLVKIILKDYRKNKQIRPIVPLLKVEKIVGAHRPIITLHSSSIFKQRNCQCCS